MESDANNDDLANRFLRLWEEAWQQMAQDPHVARCWSDLIAAFGRGDLWTHAMPRDSSDDDHAGIHPDRTTPASAASVDRGHHVEQLTRRVRDLERQVERLSTIVDRKFHGK